MLSRCRAVVSANGRNSGPHTASLVRGPAASVFPRARSRRSTLSGSARPTLPAPLQEEELAGEGEGWARGPPEDEWARCCSLFGAGPGRGNRSAPLDGAGQPAHGTARTDRGARRSPPKRPARRGTGRQWLLLVRPSQLL